MPASPPFIQALGLGEVILNDVCLMAGKDGWRSCPENCKEQVKLAQRPLGEAQRFGTSGGMKSEDWMEFHHQAYSIPI